MYKIVLGSDHAGLKNKENLKKILLSEGYTIEDCGTEKEDSCDYPDFAEKVAREIVNKDSSLGILICGTGIGMAIAANKIKGIRAALCTNEEMAKLSREHNDANILCLGSRINTELEIEKIVKTWLKYTFLNDRHSRRVQKISILENSN